MANDLRPIFSDVTREDYDKAIKYSIDYIVNSIEKNEFGSYIPNSKGEMKLGFYSGQSGVLVSLVEYALTYDDSELKEKICSLADTIVSVVNNIDFSEEKTTMPGLPLSNNQFLFENGYCGYAYALTLVYLYTEDDKYLDAAFKIIKQLIKVAKSTNGDISGWTNQLCLICDGNIILFIIFLKDHLPSSITEEIGIDDFLNNLSEYVISKVIEIDEDHLKFNMMDKEILDRFFRHQDTSIEYEYPNFNMGTAGGGFIATKLFQVTGDERLLDIAKKARNYLISISHKVTDNGRLLPFRLPDREDLYYLGYCHGAVGTSLFLQNLYNITHDNMYKDDIEEFYNAVKSTGAPFIHSPGYWHTYNQCCGTAGLLEMSLNNYLLTENEEYLSFAKDCGEKLLSEGNLGERGACWSQAWSRRNPTAYSEDLGYMNGSSGIISPLIRLRNILKGDKQYKINVPKDLNIVSRN